jgi:hypothetical protein
MKYQPFPIVLATLLVAFSYLPLSAQEGDGPTYDSDQTREIVLKMVDAHGGIEKWRSAPSISYDNIFFNPFAKTEAGKWWVYNETIDQETRMAYQDWSIDGAFLGYDGNETWTTGWARGNAPKMMVHFFYYFVNLPWLTQDDNVTLSATGTSTLPGLDKEYLTFEMRFTEKPTVGKTDRDFFKLYIDPDNHVLQGYEYSMGYGALLDGMGVPQGEIFGPMLRVHDVFAEVDGLLFPTQFHTMPPDGSTTYGNHVIINHSISKPFDRSKVSRPESGVVDPSSDKRASG